MTVLLTISTSHDPATDLGYLLHKHPDRVQAFPQSVGAAHVFYPERTRSRCTAALLLEVDPVALVRGRHGPSGDGFALGQYVNDRPYAASSMLAMALKDVFRTAFTGRCDARPDLAASPIPLDIRLPAVPCRGGADLLRRLFGPLGWEVSATAIPLDPAIPEWGESRYLDVALGGCIRLAEALNHLYVLLPVVDDAKHYWVGDDEVDKLIRAGADWLGTHPEKAMITSRYLAHRRQLTQAAMARLAEVDETDLYDTDVCDTDVCDTDVCDTDVCDTDVCDTADDATQDAAVVDTGAVDGSGRAIPLAEQRRAAVLAAVRASGARSVGDFGCGDGALLKDLLAERAIERIVAADVSVRALQIAERKLHLDTMPERQRARLQILQSALTYRDDRLSGLDAAVLMEVIEHVDPSRLDALGRTVFGAAAPQTVIVTTPNAEYNVRFATLPAGAMRHRDHRFEWTRAQFRAWASEIGARYGYEVRYLPVGAEDPELGPPTQLAIFDKAAA